MEREPIYTPNIEVIDYHSKRNERRKFAAMVLQGILSNSSRRLDSFSVISSVRQAVIVADCLIEELEKAPQPITNT